MKHSGVFALVALSFALAACKGSSSPSCTFNGGTQLATLCPTPGSACSTWPKFRADTANTGRAVVDLTGSRGTPTVLFQAHCSNSVNTTCIENSDCALTNSCLPIGGISASPVLGPTGVFLASNDGTVYALNFDGTPVGLPGTMTANGAIAGTPLIGENGNIFVPANGTLIQFFPDGAAKNSAPVNGIVSASPNIWGGNGTVYIASQAGGFSAVCPNGVVRFAASFPPTTSSAAVVQDPHFQPSEPRPIAVGGGVNGLVRAYDLKGRVYYAFFATADIIAATVIDELRTPAPVFYVADSNGRVFMVNLVTGQLAANPAPMPPFSFAAGDSIIASPALGRDVTSTSGTMTSGTTMYIVDRSGLLYALDRVTGQTFWTFQVEDPDGLAQVTSSPAVAIGGDQDVIVFAADVVPPGSNSPIKSRVFAIRDDGDSGTSLWRGQDGRDGLPACGIVGPSSAAIGPDGTVYFGLQSLSNAAPECADVVETSGGGLLAIAP